MGAPNLAGQSSPECGKTKEVLQSSKRPDVLRVKLLTDDEQSLEQGLYFVATPIGSARDITLRGLDILRRADVLAAEDTRTTRRLMDIHGIARNGRHLIAYHDHSGQSQRQGLIRQVRDGKSVAYVSDAGTPLISDPGFALARDMIGADLPVFAAPGASAVLAALTVAGLPTDRFFFAGFLPPKSGARRKILAQYASIPGSLVFYENPRRVRQTLIDLVQELGGDRQMALCRELTKKFEEVRRGTIDELAEYYTDQTPRGEVVLVVGASLDEAVSADVIDAALMISLREGMSVRDTVDAVARQLNLSKKQVYQRTLELKKTL